MLPDATECPACGASDASPREHPKTPADYGYEVVEGTSLWRCSPCGTEFALPREPMDYGDVESEHAIYGQFVDSGATAGRLHHMEGGTSHFRDSSLIYEVLRTLDADGVFLDFAAGSGYMAEAARRFGFEPHATDISAAFRTFMERSIPGVTVHESVAGFLDHGARARVALASHILEHLPSPVDDLRELRAALAPGGLLIVTVPNVDRAFYRLGERGMEIEDSNAVGMDFPPHHLTRFSRAGLDAALERAGFTGRALAYAPPSFWDLFYLGLGDPEFDFWSYYEDPVRMALIARSERNLDRIFRLLGLDGLGFSIVALASETVPGEELSELLEDARERLFRTYVESTAEGLRGHQRSREERDRQAETARAYADDLRRTLDEKEAILQAQAEETTRAFASKDAYIESLRQAVEAKEAQIEELRRGLRRK